MILGVLSLGLGLGLKIDSADWLNLAHFWPKRRE